MTVGRFEARGTTCHVQVEATGLLEAVAQYTTGILRLEMHDIQVEERGSERRLGLANGSGLDTARRASPRSEEQRSVGRRGGIAHTVWWRTSGRLKAYSCVATSAESVTDGTIGL